jgi:3-hydroxyisobutyrate dehydrogenase
MSIIGFIGLGNMGGPMAANLVRAGHRVQGYDLVPAACTTAAAQGVSIMPDLRTTAAGCDAVITMLPAGAAVRALYDDPSGILETAPETCLMIDCSTIDVESACAAHAMAQQSGRQAIDAPVSGGVGGAVAGTLTFMAGGTQAAFAAAQPLLAVMGARVVHCGAAGAGQAAKICNNMILGISMIGVSEAFVLAASLGLDARALFEVASTSSGQCWALTSYCPVPGPVPSSPANHGYKPGFAAALMLKDLALSQDAATSVGAQTALGAHAAEIYRRFVEDGGGGDDFSAIINAIRQSNPAAQ